jgi:hypothetical protein
MKVLTDRPVRNDASGNANAGRERLVAFLADDVSERMVRQGITSLALPFSTLYRGGIEKAIAHLENTRSPLALIVDISGAEMPVSAMGLPIDATVPYHPKSVVAAANSGNPLAAGRGPVSQAIANIASELTGRSRDVKKSLIGRLFK